MNLVKRIGWFLGLSGLIMFLFGLWLLISPAATVESIVVVLGLVLFIGGILNLFEALFVVKGAKVSGALAAGGLISFLVGLLILTMPEVITAGIFLTFGMLAFMLALLAFVSGLGQIYHGLTAKKGKMISIVLGAVLVLLGLFMLFHPLAAGMGLLMALGVFFIFYGMLFVVLAFNLKELVGKK